MEYTIVNKSEAKPSMDIWKKYLSEGEERKCFVGEDPEARIRKKDSMLLNLSCPEALLDNCFYPLWREGDCEIVKIIDRNLEEMMYSNNVIEIYQAIRFLFVYANYERIYETLPFGLNISKYVSRLEAIVEEKKAEMEIYREGEFVKFRKNMYQQVVSMLQKCEGK